MDTLGINLEGKERGYIGCIGRSVTNSVSGRLDSGHISKHPLKGKKPGTYLVDHTKELLRPIRKRIVKSCHCKFSPWLTLSFTSIIITSMDISRYRCVLRLNLHSYIVTGTLENSWTSSMIEVQDSTSVGSVTLVTSRNINILNSLRIINNIVRHNIN